MNVAVVDVRVMRVLMHHARMDMLVAVRLARRIGGAVRVLVMRVVAVAVVVDHRLVLMRVLVPFGEVEIKPNREERRRNEERDRDRLA